MKFRKGIHTNDYSHLRGRLNAESLLEDLGIEIGYRVGDTLMCHCPDLMGNHKNGDANPSFGYNESKLVFNCFVCGGGNSVELVKMMTKIVDDQEAIRFLEQHSVLEASGDKLLQKVQELMAPKKQETYMPDYPIDSLFQYRKIHPYLFRRGLSREIIVEMQVGFDDEHVSIVIPHFFMGKLVGIQRRHLAQDSTGAYLCPVESCNEKKVVPKYKNTPHFPKLNTLYGYDQMKEALRDSEKSEVIVVESPFTALYLMSHGYRNVVATFGQFSDPQGMLLLPIERVIFWPDNDKAGYTNAERAIETLRQYNDVFITPVVSEGKGDAANVAPEDIKKYLDLAYPGALFSFLSGQKLATIDDVAASNSIRR